MIRYIRISFAFIRYGGMIQCQSGSMICRYLPQNAIAKCLLKIKLSLTGTHLLRQKFKWNVRYSTGSSFLKSRIGNQFLKDLRKFLIIVRTNFIKLCQIHKSQVLCAQVLSNKYKVLDCVQTAWLILDT